MDELVIKKLDGYDKTVECMPDKSMSIRDRKSVV